MLVTNIMNLPLLGNSTARVIFYSCLTKSMSIPEIAELWDYKTSTYFYQDSTRKLIDDMVIKNLIIVEKGRGGGISSNIELLFDDESISGLFQYINEDNVIDLVLWDYNYEIKPSELENKGFRDYKIDQKEGLRTKVDKLSFSEKDIEKFLDLWRDDLFRSLFLSPDYIKRLFIERRNLPQDPLSFLYVLTLNICRDVGEEGFVDVYNEWGFYPDELLNPLPIAINTTDTTYQLLNLKIDSVPSKQIAELVKHIETVCKILFSKVKAYPEEITSHLVQFKEKMGFWKSTER